MPPREPHGGTGDGSPPTLPRWLRWILTLIIPSHRRDDTLGDLLEAFRGRTDRLGASAARRLLLSDALSLVAWRLRTLAWPRADLPTRSLRPDRGPALEPGATMSTRRGGTLVGDLIRDLEIGIRSLWRRPGFAALAVGVMALGIGAPTTVFSLVDTVFFFEPEQVTEPHRLVRVYRAWDDNRRGGSLGNPDFEYYRRGATAFSGLAAWGGSSAVAYALGAGRPDQMDLTFTSDNYFDVLGVPLALGRAFTADENQTPGTHPVVILSHGFWTRTFGASPDAVGSALTISGRPFTVVGVAPAGFTGISPIEDPPDAWAPIAMFGSVTGWTSTAWWERLPNERSSWLQVVGRVEDDQPMEAAQANLTVLSDALDFPGRAEDEFILVSRQIRYRPGQEAQLTHLSRMLLGAVAMVLLVALSNVAVLLLTRATTRGREMGVRTALGAARGRLARQLIAETLILGVVGGTLGIMLAYGLADLVGALLPLPFLVSFRPGIGVLSAAAGLTIFTALIVGLIPALATVRQDPARAIHGGRLEPSGGHLRHGLVVGQVALSMLLLSGAFLFARSFWSAQNQPVGFETDRRLIVQVDLRAQGYDAERGRVFVSEAIERLGGVAGVEDATTAVQIPFQGDWSTDMPITSGGDPEGETFVLYLNMVSPEFFDIMGIPLLRGRGFGSEDRTDAVETVVVNESMAQRYWPDQDPVGRTLRMGERDLVVVGVARNATYLALGEEPLPQAYLPVQQSWASVVHFLIATQDDAVEMAPVVHETIRALDPSIAFGWTTTMEAVVDNEIANYQVSAILVSAFGLVALLLAAVGLYGVVAFLVAARTPEIGLRMALGADGVRVARRVLVFATRLSLVGIVIGFGGALIVRRFTASLLFGVSPTDPRPLLMGGLALIAVTILAAWGPTRRAIRVNPLDAMRRE